MNLFENFLRGQQAVTQQNTQMLALEDMLTKKAKQQRLAQILGQAFTPGSPGTPTVDPGARLETGEMSNALAVPGTPATAPSFDLSKAYGPLAAEGFAPEALSLRNQEETAQLNKLLRQAQYAEAVRPSAPTTRSYLSGDFKVTEEFNPSSGTWREVGRGKPTPLVQVGDKADVEANKEFIKETRENYSRLSNAPAVLQNIEDAKKLIPSAAQFMGPGGGGLLEVAKFLNNRTPIKIDPSGVKSAEELRSRIFFQIMENLKKMDAQPSQKQQELMQDALGRLGTDPSALSSILDAYGDVVRQKVDLHNKTVSESEKRGIKYPYDPKIVLESRPEKQKSNPRTGRTYKVGDLVNSGGKTYVIRRLNPDGDHDIEAVQ